MKKAYTRDKMAKAPRARKLSAGLEYQHLVQTALLDYPEGRPLLITEVATYILAHLPDDPACRALVEPLWGRCLTGGEARELDLYEPYWHDYEEGCRKALLKDSEGPTPMFHREGKRAPFYRIKDHDGNGCELLSTFSDPEPDASPDEPAIAALAEFLWAHDGDLTKRELRDLFAGDLRDLVFHQAVGRAGWRRTSRFRARADVWARRPEALSEFGLR